MAKANLLFSTLLFFDKNPCRFNEKLKLRYVLAYKIMFDNEVDQKFRETNAKLRTFTTFSILNFTVELWSIN